MSSDFRDVEDDDIAKFLECRQMCQGAADHAPADQRDLLPCHVHLILLTRSEMSFRIAITTLSVDPLISSFKTAT
jgi:hypothetical protein